ncbi:hypothetical protein YC2023_042444 [Brassica napus]
MDRFRCNVGAFIAKYSLLQSGSTTQIAKAPKTNPRQRVKEIMMDSKGGKKKSRVIVAYLMKPPLVTALKMFVLTMESKNSDLLIATMQLKSSVWLREAARGFFLRAKHLSILQGIGSLCPDQVPVGRNTHLHACKIVGLVLNSHTNITALQRKIYESDPKLHYRFFNDAYRESGSGDVIVVVGDKTDVFSCMMSLIPGELGTCILASAWTLRDQIAYPLSREKG